MPWLRGVKLEVEAQMQIALKGVFRPGLGRWALVKLNMYWGAIVVGLLR